MKRIIALIVATLFVFAMSSVSFAAEEKKAAPAPMEKKAEPVKAEKKAEPAKAEKKAPAKISQVTGEVTAVDAAAKTITVKGKKGDVVIAVDEMMMKDCKAGDKVVAKFTTADGKNTAKSVKKAAEKAPKKAEEKKAEPKKAEPAKPAEKPAK
jgi:Spy/CpxP family protein refolding chaperone